MECGAHECVITYNLKKHFSAHKALVLGGQADRTNTILSASVGRLTPWEQPEVYFSFGFKSTQILLVLFLVGGMLFLHRVDVNTLPNT